VAVAVGLLAFLPRLPTGHDIFASLQYRLSAMADHSHDLSPQQVEDLRRNLRVIVQRIKPLTEELAPLTEGNCRPAVKPETK
jgi:hypothetical protein